MDNGCVSIIIPVYNESGGIGVLLHALAGLKGRFEILFVDGGSGDGTVAAIQRKGFPVVTSPAKGRANQMNYGALSTTGEVLWFLHADSLPPAAAISHIQEVLGQGYGIGCFPIRFDSKHPLMWICAVFSNLRVRFRNIAFGDQGIFLRRALFEQFGGYAPIPLMEDYQLSLEAKRAGFRIGVAKERIITSSRRFREHGRLKTMWRMQVLQHRFRRGDDIEKIAKEYYSE